MPIGTQQLETKQLEIGEVQLTGVALGWPDLTQLTAKQKD